MLIQEAGILVAPSHDLADLGHIHAAGAGVGGQIGKIVEFQLIDEILRALVDLGFDAVINAFAAVAVDLDAGVLKIAEDDALEHQFAAAVFTAAAFSAGFQRFYPAFGTIEFIH